MGAAISNQQSAISNQQSAISNQHSAFSIQHSAFRADGRWKMGGSPRLRAERRFEPGRPGRPPIAAWTHGCVATVFRNF
jgi:hypothetical protein